MDRYWRAYHNINSENLTAMDLYYVEHVDGFTVVSPLRNNPSINRHFNTELHEIIKSIKTTVLQEVSKEEALEALERTMEYLDLPKGINFLKHKL